MPIFIGHGADDEQIPVALSMRTADGLRRSGAVHPASCHHCPWKRLMRIHRVTCTLHYPTPDVSSVRCLLDRVRNEATNLNNPQRSFRNQIILILK